MPRCLFDGSGIDAFQGLSLRPAHRLHRPGAQGHRARSGATGAARFARRRPRRGASRRRSGTSRPSARAGRPERRPPALQVRRDADVRRHRHRLLDGLRQVGVLAAAAAAARADLRRARAPRADRAEDELRRAAARPRGLAPLHDRHQRQHRRAERRHDRRPEVHLAPLRGRRGARREPEGAAASRPAWRMQVRLARRPSSALRRCARPSSSRRTRSRHVPNTNRQASTPASRRSCWARPSSA